MNEEVARAAIKAGLPAFAGDDFMRAVEDFAGLIRDIEREKAISYFLQVAKDTEDQSPLGKAHWSKQAAIALRNGLHDKAGGQ